MYVDAVRCRLRTAQYQKPDMKVKARFRPLTLYIALDPIKSQRKP